MVAERNCSSRPLRAAACVARQVQSNLSSSTVIGTLDEPVAHRRCRPHERRPRASHRESLDRAVDASELAWARAHQPPAYRRPARPELMAIDQLELDALAQAGEQRRPVSGKDRLHKELVLVDQSQIRQRQRERHATHVQALAGLLLEQLNRLPQVASHQLGIPIDHAQRARHDVLLRPVDGLGERDLPLTHPVRPRARSGLPPRRLHHLARSPGRTAASARSISAVQVAHRLLVRAEPCLVMAAAVERDVDRVSKCVSSSLLCSSSDSSDLSIRS